MKVLTDLLFSKFYFGLLDLSRRRILLLHDAKYGSLVAKNLVFETHCYLFFFSHATRFVQSVENCHLEEGLSGWALYFLEISLFND